jgi:hypothetical protein
MHRQDRTLSNRTDHNSKTCSVFCGQRESSLSALGCTDGPPAPGEWAIENHHCITPVISSKEWQKRFGKFLLEKGSLSGGFRDSKRDSPNCFWQRPEFNLKIRACVNKKAQFWPNGFRRFLTFIWDVLWSQEEAEEQEARVLQPLDDSGCGDTRPRMLGSYL